MLPLQPHSVLDLRVDVGSDVTMGVFCTMTMGIIARRIGGVALQVQRGNRRPFRPTFPDPLAGRQYRSLKDRRNHLEQQARDLYDIAQKDIDKVAGNIGIPGDKALIALMQKTYESSPVPKGLPDEISELISKDQLEAAQAWFNERVAENADSKHKDMNRSGNQSALNGALELIGVWKIMAFIFVSIIIANAWDNEDCAELDKSECSTWADWYLMFSFALAATVVVLKLRKHIKEVDAKIQTQESTEGSRSSIRAISAMMRHSVLAAKTRDYVVDDEQIHDLIHSIREYKAFVDRTHFNYKAKFANCFSEAGYQGAFRTQVTGRHGIYAWLGSLEGNHQVLKPIQKFLIDLDRSAEAQKWASIQQVKPLYEFCLKSNVGQRALAQSAADTNAASISMSMRDASNNPLLMGLEDEDLDIDFPMETCVDVIGSGKHGIQLSPEMTIADIQDGSAAAYTPGIVEAKSNALVLFSLNDVVMEGHQYAMQAIEDIWDSQADQVERKLTLGFKQKERDAFQGAVMEVALRNDDVPQELRRRMEFAKDKTLRAVVANESFKEETTFLQDLKKKENRALQKAHAERLVLCAVNGESVEDLPHDQLQRTIDEHFDGQESEVVLSFGKGGQQWYQHLNLATLKHSAYLLVVGGIDHAGRRRTGYPKSVLFILTRLYFVGETTCSVCIDHIVLFLTQLLLCAGLLIYIRSQAQMCCLSTVQWTGQYAS
eukprot:COSAG02_NODE_454_length_22024_cov_9.538518_11_plen_716_part_01